MKKNKESNPLVIDFFCGAGGFSEGFRQQGYDIVLGVDHWKPAIDTFNYNFGLNCQVQDVLKFWDDLDAINALPDTNVILGSPPCISFSNSNKSGKADKALGLKLTEAFLRVVAVKKHKKNSTLEAWYMENVTNSLKYLSNHYTFEDLNLTKWARGLGYASNHIAITVTDNTIIMDASEYGSPQARKRVIIGEIVSQGRLVPPLKTHSVSDVAEYGKLKRKMVLRDIKTKLPSPISKKSNRLIQDPNYPEIALKLYEISDHFYDTGLYENQWKSSHYMKRNHPYMGRMSFPENENKPSRTITATNIGTSREAIIYKSEYNRNGHGEYRVPTVREMACLMGFPITYQFVSNSETSKSRLVGNAVCTSVSSSLAKITRKSIGLDSIDSAQIVQILNPKEVFNLNSFEEKDFLKVPTKQKGARFRRHPFKDGNITVTISNYDITKPEVTNKWITSVQYGNGAGFPTMNYEDDFYLTIQSLIEEFEGGKKFVKKINNGFSEKIPDARMLQEMHEVQEPKDGFLPPTELVDQVRDIIEELKVEGIKHSQSDKAVFKMKNEIPIKQFYALYAINMICSKANSN